MYTRIFLSVESHLMAQHLRTTIAIEQIDKSSHANHEARRHTHTHHTRTGKHPWSYNSKQPHRQLGHDMS